MPDSNTWARKTSRSALPLVFLLLSISSWWSNRLCRIPLLSYAIFSAQATQRLLCSPVCIFVFYSFQYVFVAGVNVRAACRALIKEAVEAAKIESCLPLLRAKMNADGKWIVDTFVPHISLVFAVEGTPATAGKQEELTRFLHVCGKVSL